jgi:hypothetical protein
MNVDSELHLNVVGMSASYSAAIKGGKGMKTKTWTVITNTGKQADLQSGLEKKAVQKPPYISAKEFVHWLAPDSHIDDALCDHSLSVEGSSRWSLNSTLRHLVHLRSIVTRALSCSGS